MLKKILLIMSLFLLFTDGALACGPNFTNLTIWDILLIPFALFEYLIMTFPIYMIGIFVIYITVSVYIFKKSKDI